MIQLVREFSEDTSGCGGHRLVFDDGLIDCLDVRGVVGGEDGDV